jgi:hypothetical protein
MKRYYPFLKDHSFFDNLKRRQAVQKALARVVGTYLLILCAGVHAGDPTCYGYTSTTSHFECGAHGNCTWWAAYKRPDIARVVSGSGWNGGEWYDQLENKGFDVGSDPKIGAIAEFSGHVAYVKDIYSDGSFTVSEMDYYGTFGNGVQHATYAPNDDGTYQRNDETKRWTLNGFIYRRQTGADIYCADISSIWGICWKPSQTDVSCQGGTEWTLYDFELSDVIRVSSNQYCPETGGIGGGDPTPIDTTPIGETPEPESGPRADLYPDYDIKRNGGEISANCDNCNGKAITAGEELEYKGAIKVANDDAGNWKRKDSVTKVEGTFFWRIPGLQDSWKEFCTEEYTISKLDEGDTIQGTCWWDVPMVPEEGYVLETAFCPDRDDIIWEEDETENRDKISDPIDDDGINCSRTERNYIRLPQYEPTGAIESVNCDEVVGWAKDGNSVSPLWVRIQASGIAQLPDVLADNYRSDVGGKYGLRWTVPDELKDGTAHTVAFTAVNVPIGNNVEIGQANLTCSPPVPPYDVATIATWIDGEYTLESGENFTIRGVVENLGSDVPGDVTLTSTLIHSDGTQYAMGSVVIGVGSLMSGFTADVNLEAVAPSEAGLYSLKTCVTAGFGESNDENNCLEENGPYIADPIPAGLSDDEETAIWIINQER